ncbi:hypothetical protein C8F04DRAFT_1059311 [Mycena alexandri]|uniref:Uncharacterized protein n=1 Tax=Mycena alexandri TaxID=1745969 RepID=A0AAD6TJ31_9AGAR|nr:hypothetical protein C8F04DRAFT_1059311 [Mycena alexandri]
MPPAATQPASPKSKSSELPPTPKPVKKELPPAKRTPSLPKSTVQPVEQKKASHRSSKPIINWFQRKLAGGSSLVKSKRAENQQPLGVQGRPASIPLRSTNRISSAPLPSGATKHLSKLDIARRKTISLNEEDDGELYANDLASERSRDSTWSPLEADEDASVRPLPPSAPPSPSPSLSTSSYVSDPRTFRSIAASTKPTTLLSIDLNGNGMAHIAQAPAAPISRLHVRSSSSTTTPAAVVGSGASITFSALPPSPISSSVDAAARSNGHSLNPSSSQPPPNGSNVSSVQAPLHTAHHPRNNPRPSSPPLDNASVLTLASSAYAIPSRAGINTPGWSSAPPSALNDSLSHFGGSITYADAESTSQYLLGEDDVDASVRALRPRSSRRGSWESEASRWSARVAQNGAAGTPSLARDGRSMWTSNSVRTGGLSVENGMYERSDEGDDRSDTDEASQTELSTVPPLNVQQLGSPGSDAQPTPKNALQGGEAYIAALRVPLPESTEDLSVSQVEAVDFSTVTVNEDPKDEDLTPNERPQDLA